MINKKIAYLSSAAVIAPTDSSESLRINYVDVNDTNLEESIVYCTGEESGEEYEILVTEVDFENSIFYEFKLMDDFNKWTDN